MNEKKRKEKKQAKSRPHQTFSENTSQRIQEYDVIIKHENQGH